MTMFDITRAAMAALLNVTTNSVEAIVPFVTWESNETFTAGHWVVAFIGRDKVASTAGVIWIEKDGVEIAVDGPHHFLPEIEGSILDIDPSGFVFRRAGD